MRTRRDRPQEGDFREFLFRATGRQTDPGRVDFIDVCDNLVAELDRLAALAELLAQSRGDIQASAVAGAAALLEDVEQRMREVLARGASCRRRPEALE